MAIFQLNDSNVFTVKHLTQIGKSFYYIRRIPATVAASHFEGRKKIKIKLDLKNGSYASQVGNLAKSHDALFKGLEAHPDTKLPSEKEAARKLLYEYGLKEGQGMEPAPVSKRAYPNASDTPHLDEFFADYDQAKASGILNPVQELAMQALRGPLPTMLSELFDQYVELEQKDARWVIKQRRVWLRFLSIVGDMPVATLNRDVARRYREVRESHTVKRLNDRGVLVDQPVKSGTIDREINFLKAAINRTLLELDESVRNPFTRMRSSLRGKDATIKEVLTSEEFAHLVKYCQDKADTTATIILTLAFSGVRIGELVGVRKEDVFLDAPIPYFTIVEYGERSLKNARSARNMPIHDLVLPLLRTQYEKFPNKEALFPNYNNLKDRPKADAASACINKRLGVIFKDKHVTSHVFRHNLISAFRNALVPRERYEIFAAHDNQRTSENYGVERDISIKSADLIAAIDYQLRPVLDQAKTKPAKKKVAAKAK